MIRGWSLAGLLCAVLAACGGQSGKSDNAARGAGGSSGFGKSDGAAGATATTGSGGAQSSAGVGAMAGATASAGGGAASAGGGAASAGAPTRPGDLPVPPADCKAVSQHVGSGVCSYAFECEATPFYARCERGLGDAWPCQCNATTGGAVLKELVLHGVDEATACGAVARACMTALPEGERICERSRETFTADSCSISESCGPSFDLGSGVTAHGVERHSVSCGPGSAGKIACNCVPDVVGMRDFRVSALSIDGVCDAMIGICSSGALSTSAGALACMDEVDTPLERHCAVTRSCSQSTGLGSDFTLSSSLTLLAYCDARGDGTSPTCTCSDSYSARFDLDTQAEVDTDTCVTLLHACTGMTKLEPNGAVRCEPTTLSERPQACGAKLLCKQPMKAGPLDIIGHGELNLRCQQNPSGGSWWCSCVAQSNPKTFELGAAPTALDACTAAAARCPQEVDIVFGLHAPLPTLPAPI